MNPVKKWLGLYRGAIGTVHWDFSWIRGVGRGL